MNNIGGGVVGAHAGIRIEAVGSEVVCLVDVSAVTGPGVRQDHQGRRCFYVRVNNTTRMLEGPDIPAYIDGHWTK